MTASANRGRGIFLLLFHLSWICLLWGICLPRLANWPPIRKHIDEMGSSEVNVDAMFYTELSWHPGM